MATAIGIVRWQQATRKGTYHLMNPTKKARITLWPHPSTSAHVISILNQGIYQPPYSACSWLPLTRHFSGCQHYSLDFCFLASVILKRRMNRFCCWLHSWTVSEQGILFGSEATQPRRRRRRATVAIISIRQHEIHHHGEFVLKPQHKQCHVSFKSEKAPTKIPCSWHLQKKKKNVPTIHRCWQRILQRWEWSIPMDTVGRREGPCLD